MSFFDETQAPLWDHIEALRKTFVRILLVVAFGIILSFSFYENLFSLLTDPLKQADVITKEGLVTQTLRRERLLNTTTEEIVYREGRLQHIIAPGGYLDVDKPVKENKLLILGPLEGMMTAFKISFWVGLVATSPIWCFYLIQFILPALKSQEKALIIPFVMMSLLFLSGGFFFAYQITIPLANGYLEAFNSGIGTNLWSLAQYLDYTVVLLLGHGLAFEFCLILLFLVHLRVITAEQMIRWRRHMIVAAFIVGAILTPPDIFSQVMLAVPLILFYEVAILYARLRAKGQQNINCPLGP